MLVIDHLDLPIEKTYIAGPAVDAHKYRKEEDNDLSMTKERLRTAYLSVKDNNLKELKKLAERTAGDYNG